MQNILMYMDTSFFVELYCSVYLYLTGNKPPGLVPNKFMYMTKDLHRLAEYFGVPLHPPSDPFEAMFQKGKHKNRIAHVMCLDLVFAGLTC